MANPVFAQITAQPTAMFLTGSGERPLINQDELLVRYPGAIGGKTIHQRGTQDLRRSGRPE